MGPWGEIKTFKACELLKLTNLLNLVLYEEKLAQRLQEEKMRWNALFSYVTWIVWSSCVPGIIIKPTQWIFIYMSLGQKASSKSLVKVPYLEKKGQHLEDLAFGDIIKCKESV